ncbi:MAG: hypothetical protein B6D39_01125 [Anaerolineae bacterium UTCFX2]|jgi:membrane peptidoglycan carboxypeptidase|nr:transglycosylase domain-containing protein [Anaerolineae bacterium]MCZ7553111.1 transglycosylase domain-containing protein [Anaerolineales bacterium]OQY94681.1 MAG: hypothetical protein B6D39_01125 [Anaerolineae bacterium UTCFX2]
MPSVHQTIQFRNQRRQKAERKSLLGAGILACIVFSLAAAAAGIFLALEYAALTQDLPSVEALPDLLEPPEGRLLKPTHFFDRTGQQVIFTLQNAASSKRTYLAYPPDAAGAEAEETGAYLPPDLVNLTVASIDPGFWSHSGITLSSVLFLDQRTVAQRLAADLLLMPEPPGRRRDLRMHLLALQIIDRFGHKKALEWYLNSAYFGNLAYGVQSASELYFGKPVSELNLADLALLAATLKDPAINPWSDLPLVQVRQKQIIQEALRQHLVSPSESVQAIRAEPNITPPTAEAKLAFADLHAGVSPAYIKLVLEQLGTRISRVELERGGLNVITTLDLDLQTQVDCTSRFLERRLQATADQPPAGIPVSCPAARLLPALPENGGLPSGDLSTETIILDPGTGQILAFAGDSPGNVAGEILPAHPGGTSSTIFIYLTGLTRGLNPASLVWDVPSSVADENPQENQAYHGPVRLRIAFVNDYLPPAEAVLSQVGVENVLRTSQQLGLSNLRKVEGTPRSATNLLGDVNLLEITHALSAFANQGALAGRTIDPDSQTALGLGAQSSGLPPIEPTVLLRVEDTRGKGRLDWSAPQERPILTPQLAYLMTHMLSDEPARWLSLGHPNPLEIGRPAAAKISAVPDDLGAWVAGYTPRRVVGVWLGTAQAAETPTSLPHTAVQEAAAGLWHAIMQYSNQSLPYETFTPPTGISFSQVCDPSGLLPTAACPNVVDEVFLSGNEPAQIDTLYHLVSINRLNGQLATIFTPPDLIEQRSFISIPPEAGVWARNSGLETPPNTYENLPLQTNRWLEAQITSPRMLDHVSGVVKITGKATGANFANYQIQYGAGALPTRWFQVGEASNVPVAGGLLANWDTHGLDGLYALQLLLVRQDQSAERSTIFVTVDNQPPSIEILSPRRSETINRRERPKIVLQARIDDDYSVASVVFKIDQRLIASLLQAPYAISWTVSPGDHVFEVTATDMAGNTSSEKINFQVE